MENKLIVTAAPHITSADTTSKIMQRVCIALLPTLVAAVIIFKLNADLCMSCGTCSFVCPAKRPLAPSIAQAKIMMKNGGKK